MMVKYATPVFQYLTWCSLVERVQILWGENSVFCFKGEKEVMCVGDSWGHFQNTLNYDENSSRRKSEYCNLDTKIVQNFFFSNPDRMESINYISFTSTNPP